MNASQGAGRPNHVISAGWLFVAVSLSVLIFATDALTVAGLPHGLLYSLPIISCVFSLQRKLIIYTTLASIVLCVAGFFISPRGAGGLYPMLNRVAAALVVATIGILAAKVIGYVNALVDARDAALKAAEELQRAEKLVKGAGRLARVGGWSIDAATKTVEWSDETAAAHDLASGGLISLEKAIQFYTPESQQMIARLLDACLRDGVPYDEEFEIITATGRRAWIRTIAEATRDDMGSIIRVDGAIQDITETRILEQNLAETRNRFGQLVDAMPLIVWTTDARGALEFSSRALFTYVGAEAIAPRDLDWTTCLHCDDVHSSILKWQQCIKSGEEGSFEARLRSADGIYRWHLFRLSPVRNRFGQVVRWFGFAANVENEKRNEQSLSLLSRRLMTTLESITDAFFMVDEDWRFTYANPQFLGWLGERGEDIIGKSMWEEFPQAVNMQIYRDFNRAIRTSQPAKLVQYLPVIEKWTAIHASPSEEGMSVYLHDITRQRQLDEKLRQAQELETIGRLTGGIAHDFNNLLTVILGNAEVLTEALSHDGALHPLANLTLEAAERGAELVARLLAFSRRQPLNAKPIDVNGLISSLDGLLRRTLGEHIEINICSNHGLWRAFADQPQVESALLNLCLNARDAMLETGRLTIRTANTHLRQDCGGQSRDAAPGDYVMIEVSDTGQGMPADIISKAFDPFFTTKPQGQGSGLGLSMVYGLAMQSDGHVDIDSKVGEGTTVRLYLPRATSLQTSLEHLASEGVTPKGGERILLVEDDEIVREHVLARLLELGYDVTAASDGREAIIILENDCSFELLFTDIVMPHGISGLQLAARAKVLCPGLRVLLTSGYSGSQQPGAKMARLDYDILAKPYKKETLAMTLRRVLDR